MKGEYEIMSGFEHHLDTYAELIVKIGVNVQQGQEVFVTGAVDQAALVRLVAAKPMKQARATSMWNGLTIHCPD